MIIHYKDIFDELQFKLGNHLKYSEEYTFIPFGLKINIYWPGIECFRPTD